MADVQVPAIATVSPGAGDTVLGVQGGQVKRIPVGTGSGLAREVDLANAVDPAKGASIVFGAREVVRLKDYCSGNYDHDLEVGDDDTLGMRAAVARCPDGGIIVGEPGAHYLITRQNDGKCVEVVKNVRFDFQFSSVTYKPWSDAAPQTVHAPALHFKGQYSSAGTLAADAHTDEAGIQISGSVAVGDMIKITSNKIALPWNYPRSTYESYTGWSEVAFVKAVSGGNVTIHGRLHNEYPAGSTVETISPLTGVSVANIRSAGEIDANLQNTAALSGGIGHFLSFEGCVGHAVKNITVDRGHRLFAVWAGDCISPMHAHVSSSGINQLYPPLGGHAYTMRYNGCIGAMTQQCSARGARHLIDYTYSHDSQQIGNRAYDSVAASYHTHGFGERNIKSIADASESSLNPNGFSQGWLVGNDDFGPSFNVSIDDFVFRGPGTGVNVTAKSDGVHVANLDAITYDSSPAFQVTNGARNCTLDGAELESADTDGVTAANPLIKVGSNRWLPTGSTTLVATAGTNPLASVATSNATGVQVSDDLYIDLYDYHGGEWSGVYTVEVVTSPTQFSARLSGTTANNISASWDGGYWNRRIIYTENYPSCENVSVKARLKPNGLDIAGAVISATGDVHIDLSVSGASAGQSLVQINSLGSPAQPVNVRARLSDAGSVSYSHAVRAAGIKATGKFEVSECACRSFTGYLLNAVNSDLGNCVRVHSNDGSAASAAGLVSFDLWSKVAGGADYDMWGNKYPAAMSVTKNFESGSFALGLSCETPGAPAALSNSTCKYSYSNRSLSIAGRVTWSGLGGSGGMFITGMPSLGSSGAPVSAAEVTISTGTGAPALNWTSGRINIREFKLGATSYIPLAASGDVSFSGRRLLG